MGFIIRAIGKGIEETTSTMIMDYAKAWEIYGNWIKALANLNEEITIMLIDCETGEIIDDITLNEEEEEEETLVNVEETLEEKTNGFIYTLKITCENW